MKSVLLLREPSEDSPDRYEAAFSAAGYHAISVPVLETVHTNVETLRSTIENGAKSLSGVVITSKRSCDAWKEALLQIQASTSTRKSKEVASWCELPFYVVGETTATALRTTFEAFEDLGLTSVDVRGQSSGNAAILGPFILQDLQNRQAKLLYLTGDKNRDTLPSILNEGGVSLEALQVYMTQGSSSFETALVSALEPSNQEDWWIVYFAPSAATFVTPTLQHYFHLHSHDSGSTVGGLRKCKVAAIGPSTDAFLRDDLRIRVDAMAQKPTPEEIVAAIRRNDSGIP